MADYSAAPVGSAAFATSVAVTQNVNYGLFSNTVGMIAYSYTSDGLGNYALTSTSPALQWFARAVSIEGATFTLNDNLGNGYTALINGLDPTIVIQNDITLGTSNMVSVQVNGHLVIDSATVDFNPGMPTVTNWMYNTSHAIDAVNGASTPGVQLSAFYPATRDQVDAFSLAVSGWDSLSVTDPTMTVPAGISLVINVRIRAWNGTLVPYPSSAPYLPESTAGYSTTWL
jgi:hypothetical protein